MIGYAAVQARRHLLADRRSAGGDRRHRRGGRDRRARRHAARRHRHGQDDDDGRDDRAAAAAGAGDRAQQDARGPALQRVPDVLPAQLGRVLRLVLRLLPARGVRPVARPLHREGLGDQPGDRPAAPRRDGVAVRAPRRGDRRVGVVHLRPRLARDLQRELPGAGQGRLRRPRRAAAQARLAPVQPQRPGARARHVPRARRHAGGLPGVRGDGVPGDAVRRRGRAAAALRPADGRAHQGRPRARRRLAGDALQRPGGAARGGGRRDRARAQRALRGAGVRGQAARVAPPAPAHAVRHGDAARGRVLLGHRELLAHPRRARARLAPVLPDRLLPRTTSSASSTSRTRPCRRSAACTRATARASRRWSTTASGCPSALDNRPQTFEEFLDITPQLVFVSATPGQYERVALGARGRADRPADGHRRPGGRGARDAQPDRRPDERRSASASSATSARWSPRSRRR